MTAGAGSQEPDFRQLFQAIPTPTMVLDATLTMIAMTDSYLAVARVNSREDLVGRTPMEAFPDNPDDPDATGVGNLTRSLRTVLATGRPDTMALQRYDVQAKPGGPFEERYWSPVNTPVLDADGQVVWIIHRVEEVTDYVRARGAELARATSDLRTRAGRLEADLISRAREVQDANRQLREANHDLAVATEVLRRQHEAKDRFIAILSHELRNPLAAIRAAIDLLSLGTTDAPAAIGVLERQAGALVRMTDDLLDSSRALTGRLTLTQEALDLRTVVSTVTGDFEPRFTAGDRALAVKVPDHPLVVDGDRVRLSQMIGNLLRNSLTCTRPGGAVLVQLTGDAGQAVLAVTDNGAGFDPADAEKLFEVFERGLPSGALSAGHAAGVRARRPQAGESEQEGPGGLGLGLGLVRSIAELHGGEISAHSAGPGTGARFEVRLPLAARQAAPAISTEGAATRAAPRSQGTPQPTGTAAGECTDGAQAPSPGNQVPPHAGLRALIIEDNEDLAQSYRLLLRRRGDQVSVARTGREGLALAQQQSFDLILCDIGLPDLDGRDIARRLRAHPRRSQMRVIAVSGFGQEADRAASARAGFDAHLVKPMALADLDAVLAGHFSS